MLRPASRMYYLSEGTVDLKLVVCEDDKGKIIGKQGRVIKAVRALVGATAAKKGKRAFLEVE